jgi:hypothetical protein
MLAAAGWLPARAGAQTSQRCFAETGHCISGRIREFWEGNGGLPVFGLPIAPQREEQIEGRPFQAQWFERNRLELHPENARPYDVLLGRLGVDRLAAQGRDWFAFAKSEPQAGCRFFPETGHNICGAILAAWRASGLELDGRRGKSETENLALFGLPVSEAQTETIEGREYTVQWFERARFELHPENQPPYDVLLGLLGNEVHGPAEPPPPPPPPAGSLAIDGNWSGTTLQGKQIAFVITGRGFSSFTVEYQVEGCGVKLTSTPARPIAINGNSFEYVQEIPDYSSGGKYKITTRGVFSSPTAASGTMRVEDPRCGSADTTWTAAKQ